MAKRISVSKATLIKFRDVKQRDRTYFACRCLQSIPIYSGKYVADEVWLEVQVLLHQFGVAEVKGKGC